MLTLISMGMEAWLKYFIFLSGLAWKVLDMQDIECSSTWLSQWNMDTKLLRYVKSKELPSDSLAMCTRNIIKY